MRQPLCRRLSARSLLTSRLHPAPAVLALMLVSSGSYAQTAAALPSGSSSVATKSDAVTPVPGWTRFCNQRPAECTIDLSEPAAITLTPQAWQTITRMNRQVNATVKPMTDHEHWGVE